MKKFVILLSCIAFAVATASADIFVGIRGTIAPGLGASTSMSGIEMDLSKSWIFGGAVYAKIPISVVENLYVQPEAGIFRHTYGLKYKDLKDARTEFSYTAMTIPVMLAYDFPVTQSFIVTIEGGPHLSFITSKINAKTFLDGETSSDDNYNPDSNILFGAMVGAGISYAFSSGTYIMADLRYDFGFNEVKIEDSTDGVTPRGFDISAGFQLRF